MKLAFLFFKKKKKNEDAAGAKIYKSHTNLCSQKLPRFQIQI